MLDLPGIIEGAKDGKGRGRQVISTARTCNLILIVLDCLKPITHKKLIEHELEGFGIRLNKKPPGITFRKKDKGGISFTSQVKEPKLDLESVKAVCSEYRLVSCTRSKFVVNLNSICLMWVHTSSSLNCLG